LLGGVGYLKVIIFGEVLKLRKIYGCSSFWIIH